MLNLRFTATFKRDYRRVKSQGKNLAKIPSCRKLVFPKLASILSCCLFHSSLCMAAKWGGTLLDRAPLPPSPGGWKVG